MEKINKNRRPVIRFKGFTDDWEQRKLGELGDIKTGNTPSTNVKEYYSDNGMQWVTPTDITTNVITSTAKKISKEGEKVARIVPANTILCTCIASLGKNAIVLEKSAFNQQINSLTANEKLHDSYFLLTNSFYWSKSMKELAGGLTFPIVNKTEFSEIETWTPKNIEEEKKIGTFFKKLDHLITLHQQKYDKLINIKRSLLEKMFPKNGQNVPELRFKGFTDAWEQRKFSELAQTRRGLTYSPKDIGKNGIRVLRSSNISDDKFVITDDDVFVTKEAVNINFIKNDDILITSANGSSKLVGKHTLIQGISSNSAVHGGFMLVATAYKNPYFLNASMSSNWYKKFIDLYVSGGNGAIGNLSKSDLDEQVVLVPNIEEQDKIGNFFKQLDHLITLHQQKLNKLKNIKKSLLDKMFV